MRNALLMLYKTVSAANRCVVKRAPGGGQGPLQLQDGYACWL